MGSKLLALIAGGAAFLFLAAPPQFIIFYELALLRFPQTFKLAGIYVDAMDVCIGFLLASVVLRGWPARGFPYLKSFAALATFMALSYLVAPDNADNLTSPVRIVYQLYRYCLRPMLYYPICIYWLRDRKHQELAVLAGVLGADGASLVAIQQGFAGVNDVIGPFVRGNGNMLGSALIIPLVLAIRGTLFPPPSRWTWLFYLGSTAVIARALLFSASRGAMVGVAGSLGYFLAIIFFTHPGRKRLLSLVPIVLVGIVALFAFRPDVLERSSVQHVFSTLEGSQTDTMQWRISTRWPHFYRRALQKPWLGWGNSVDVEEFGDSGNTPHNGYLALANRNGIVVPLLYLLFFYRMVRDNLKVFKRSKDFQEQAFVTAMPAAALGLMLHNIVDTTMTIPYILKYFWLVCALVTLRAHYAAPEAEAAVKRPVPRHQPVILPPKPLPRGGPEEALS